MPDTDGVTLLKEWQRDGLLTMPVIMMSGHATIDTAVEATRIGALNFLEKPIALQKLLKAVQQGLSRAHEPARHALFHPRSVPVANEETVSAQAAPFAAVASSALPQQPATPSAPAAEGHFFGTSFDLPLRDACISNTTWSARAEA
jgi:DNA-binding NtrC family response regulator